MKLMFHSDFSRNRAVGSVSIEGGRNYVSRKSGDYLNSASLQCFGLSADGGWLATAELFTVQSILGHPHVETTVRVWKRNVHMNRAEFAMHTEIYRPHEGALMKLIKFRPNSLEFVTCTESRGFGIWRCVGGKWRCRNIGEYRGQQITDIDFSPEGSLLVITFSPTVTIWEAESVSLLREFNQLEQPLKVRFAGSGTGLPKLLTLSESKCLRLYDLRTSEPPNTISSVLEFSVLGTKIGVLLKEEILVYDSESMRSAEQRWKIQPTTPIPDHFILFPCGGTDFGITVVSQDRKIQTCEYLNAIWNDEDPPQASEQTVFQQLYAPTEIKRLGKRKREAEVIEPRKVFKIQSLVPPIFMNPSYSLPSLRYVLQTVTEEISKVDPAKMDLEEGKEETMVEMKKKENKIMKAKKISVESSIFSSFKPKTSTSFDFDLGLVT